MIKLSSLLFKKISLKLKLDVSNLEYDKFQISQLLRKSFFLQTENHSLFYTNLFLNDLKKKHTPLKLEHEDFVVMYVINIAFLKANTIVNISDAKGNIQQFYTSGSVNLIGKQKKKREIALFRLISLISKKAVFLEKKPVALHLLNVRSHKNFIINKLKQNFFIKIIKSFNTIPFNGCRKKKFVEKNMQKKFIKRRNG